MCFKSYTRLILCYISAQYTFYFEIRCRKSPCSSLWTCQLQAAAGSGSLHIQSVQVTAVDTQDIPGSGSIVLFFYALHSFILFFSSTFMELKTHPDPVYGMKKSKVEFKWSPDSWQLLPEQERWKVCSSSPCVSRPVRSWWVPFLQHSLPINATFISNKVTKSARKRAKKMNLN